MSTPPALRRRLPDVQALGELMKFGLPSFGTEARLAKAATIWDLRAIAKRRTPSAPFDYTDGAADGEITMNRSREAFRQIEFHPAVLRDVAEVDLRTEILGRTSSMPFGIAPTGFARLMQSEGEYAGSAAAAAAGIPFTLSTLGTASVEEVAAHAPQARRWFQLYATQDKERNLSLIQRAEATGNDTIMLTVDTAVGGLRLRDVRNGMTIPPQLSLKTVLDASYRPAWWFNFLTRAPLEFSSLSSFEGTVSELLSSAFDPGLDYQDLEWLRANWHGNLLVKGVQTVADAQRAMDHGADGVVLSNHGGRQLDRAPLPFHLLPEVRKALGEKATVMMDTGIMSGGDIVAAIASGADFVLIGRAYLYGLMAGGERGVSRALAILQSEITRTMKLLGVSTVAELNPDHLNQRAETV
ncbi:alpha-hydroxy acid oxidase [Arthrobacter russicus]|uniref:L-lactate dehydrogenase (Cytochrome) n=1 Tax=Arthrobacter russicus TaxID=172040 RepID=A0ABU1JCN3_9MICC|nr:alpha-hydroxy acid oxidase [Arthrobacter russicus]MDR6270187.1 L-lactate dehydrogenase (cytochrome) [Arthrobacter russicus]